MPFFIPFLIVGAVAGGIYLDAKAKQEEQERLRKIENDKREPWIALVGPTSSGKSTIASIMYEHEKGEGEKNPFIIGAEHGSTTVATFADYKRSWKLVDTPGIHDGELLAKRAYNVARKSKVIILCLDAQMYRGSMDWVASVLNSIGHDKTVTVIPYLGKLDIRERMMTVADRNNVTKAVEAQIKDLKGKIYNNRIVIKNLIEGWHGDIDKLVYAAGRAMADY